MGKTRWLLILCGVLAAGAASAALAETFPSRPVKMVVTYPPGGSSDLMARILGQKLSEVWGQPVIIESKRGAGGSIGMDFARQQPADGYSMVMGNLGPVTVNPLLTKVPFDSERDFVPVSLIATGPNILVVNPALPVKTLGEVIAYAKAHPGELNFGSGGAGSVAHLSGEMLKNLAHVDITHVPYKGGILSVQDLVAGHVQLVFSDALPAMQFIRSGRLRAIAVTGSERSPFVPEVPTCAESGLPDLVAVNWWGILLPAHTPPAIVAQYHDALVKVLQSADVKQKFGELGVDAVSSTPQEFGAFMRRESAKYARLIKEAGIKVD
jgi:tripartite-type tricarboxylate transporter receptor subunit TctC